MRSHSYSCPHNCKTCNGDLFYIDEYRKGGCLVCGKKERDGLLFAHNDCYYNASRETRDLIHKLKL